MLQQFKHMFYARRHACMFVKYMNMMSDEALARMLGNTNDEPSLRVTKQWIKFNRPDIKPSNLNDNDLDEEAFKPRR